MTNERSACSACGQPIRRPRSPEPSAMWLACERRAATRPLTVEEVPHAEEFGRVLRRYRQLAGLSMRELGQRSRLHPRTISRLEIGARRPRATTIERLVRGLGPAPWRYLRRGPVPRADAGYALDWEDNPDRVRLRIHRELIA